MDSRPAPCALCLRVDELDAMLPVVIDETPTRSAFQIAICADCMTSIIEAMAQSDRWSGDGKTESDHVAEVSSPGGDDAAAVAGDRVAEVPLLAGAPASSIAADPTPVDPEMGEYEANGENGAKRKRRKAKPPFFAQSGSHKK